jgi:Tetratricopeptide repeat
MTRERVPLDWAMTQNNLGNALSTLGERESGTGRLEEAVAAYRAALKEWTQAAAPYQHQIAQENFDRVNASLAQRRNKCIDRNVSPSRSRRLIASRFWCGVSLGLRPNFTPLAFASARPR